MTKKREYISLADVQEAYGISRSTAYRAIKAGTLTLHKFGSKSLLKVAELEARIEAQAPAT